MSIVALILLSSSLLAVLGLGTRALRSAASARRSRALLAARERALFEAACSFFEASRRSSDDVLAALAEGVRALDGALDALLVFTAAGEELACTYAAGSRAEHFRRLRVRRDDVRLLPVAAAAAGCRAAYPSDGERLFPNDRAALAVPMLDASGLHAVVYMSSLDARALAQRDLLVRAVEHAATPYAAALEREADRAHATYDGLTGALTPRAFRDRLRAEIEAAASGAVLSVWFVDTDRFKRVNDEFGHAAGDGVLVAMAALLRAHAVPNLDLVARNGGDEFCALIRGVPKSVAVERAQAFCEAVRAHDFGLPARVTASVGVATFPYDASNSSELLEAADAAMYHSKREGRDRVAFALERDRYEVFASGLTRG